MARQPIPAAAETPRFNTQKTPTGRIHLLNGAAIVCNTSVNEFVPGMVALDNELSSLVADLNNLVSEIHPDRFGERAEARTELKLPAVFQQAVQGGQKAGTDHALNKGKFEIIPASTDAGTDSIVFVEWRNLPNVGAKIKAVAEWPINALFAVLRPGREIAGLSDAMFEEAMKRVRRHNVIASDANRTSFVKQPSLEMPLARGSDEAKLEAYADECLAAWSNRDDLLFLANQTLQHVAAAVSKITNTSAHDAFNMLMGKDSK